MGITPITLAIVLLVTLLLFGNRLPGLARSMGQSITEFKKGVKEIDHKEASGEEKTS